MRRLVTVPLTPETYAPYGAVLAAGAPGVPAKLVNQGTARRFDRLVAIDNRRPATATLNVAIFRCEPRRQWPMRLRLLEKHASSTQVFVPITARRYVVLVALGGERPDPATLAAFLATGDQGVSYGPGIWHHPLLALDEVTDFTCLVCEDGTAGDCTVARWSEEDPVEVDLP